MRKPAQNVALLLSVALVATLACSKTQDTAPERRLFGEPPVINSVEPVFADPNASAQCDFTTVAQGFFCPDGIPDAQPQAGRGWSLVAGSPDPVYADVPTTVPGVFIEGTYTELLFKVHVTDANSTPGNSNILLVSASYVQVFPSNIETSLVLFDDGSENNFPVEQSATPDEDVVIDVPNGTCVTKHAIYPIKSGDEVKNNDLYTRRFAIINKNTSSFMIDCIKKSENLLGVFANPGDSFDFTIEAVDRQGNLTVWPSKLTSVTGTGSFTCLGDSCGCCLVHALSQQTDINNCRGEPGMTSSAFPNGICVDAL